VSKADSLARPAIARLWVRVSLAVGCRVVTVGQLLFTPWAWAYSTLYP